MNYGWYMVVWNGQVVAAFALEREADRYVADQFDQSVLESVKIIPCNAKFQEVGF